MVIYENNAACIAQSKENILRRTDKYIQSKFFYTHKLQKNNKFDIN